MIKNHFAVSQGCQSQAGNGRATAKAVVIATIMFGLFASFSANAQVTSTSLTSSGSPSEAGDEVVFTATVSPAPNVGTVVFSEGGVPVDGCDARPVDIATGIATCSIRYGTIGNHTVIAAYTGGGTFLVSSSTPLTQVVEMATSTSTALVSSVNPSQVSQQVVYTATVSAVPDGGTVAFSEDGSTIPGCSAQVVNTTTGESACAVIYDVTGVQSIQAVYSGNVSFPGSTSTALTQTINQVATSTAVASSMNPSALGEQVIYTVTVSPAPVGGTVMFSEDGSTIAACAAQTVDPVTGVSRCAVSYTAAGNHSIEAAFSGDASYGASTSAVLSQSVTWVSPTYTNPGTYLYTVPAGTLQMTFDVYGAQGGNRICPGSCGPSTGAGGQGGKALATMVVAPGETLQISVGARGAGSGYYSSAGGGGASDVRQGDCAATLSCGFSDRIVVAGGGGGGGDLQPAAHTPGWSSAGGGGSGGDGEDGDGDGGSVTQYGGDCQSVGGGGGSSVAGGAGGNGYTNGTAGSLGFGGTGGQTYNMRGGNGGDGYYGGGGGGGGTYAWVSGFCDGLGGGGGSGYITPTAIVALIGTGVQPGNGKIVITAIQLDADGDGVPDVGDLCPGTGAGDQVDLSGCAATQIDTDGDGTNNEVDQDDDNDGVPDAGDSDALNPAVCRDTDNDTCDDCSIQVDGFGPLNDFDPFDDGPDLDADGICDATDTVFNDLDGDLIPDALDPDDDNDGVLDDVDSNSLNPAVCQDTDNDTCDDCSVQIDGFGLLNDFDPFNDGPDADVDGICDAGDTIFNDWDRDLIPDALDPDDDNDGVDDVDDDLPFDPTETKDNDQDGLGDNADRDDDNDGITDALDLDPNVASNACTGEDAVFEELVVAGLITCAARSSVMVWPLPDSLVEVLAGGELLLIAPIVTFEPGLSVSGSMAVVTADPCPNCTFEVGDTGLAGGIVFYVTPDGRHGLEAASVDLGTAPWGCYQSGIPGADGAAVGTGEQNTAEIMTGCAEAGIAARLAADYEQGGFADWFLPSKDELNLMYTQLYLLGRGGFGPKVYWSSTEVNADKAWLQHFFNGSQYGHIDKNATAYNARAVRAF